MEESSTPGQGRLVFDDSWMDEVQGGAQVGTYKDDDFVKVARGP